MTTITQTTNKIQALTPEQLTAMPEYVNKWTSIGLSVGLTDEDKGTAAIVQMYEIGGLQAPKVHWFDSPMAALLAAAADAKQGSRINPETFSQVKEQIYDQILESVRSRIYDQVCIGASGQVLTQVVEPVQRQAYEFDESALRCIEAEILDQTLDHAAFDFFLKICRYWDVLGGLGMASTGAYFDFLANAMHLDIGYEKLAGIIGAVEQASFIYPFGDRAYAVRKMCKRSRDEQGRLHCEDGPAILFNDGFSVYAWHGVQLLRKKWIITNPEKITAETIENESDPEVKRVMTERLAARG
jgi:hypothetical protein